MITNEQLNKDMQDIIMLGTDVMLYVEFARFMNSLGDDDMAKELKESIARLARLVRILNQ